MPFAKLIVLFILLAIAVSGCVERTAEDMLENYASRLARVLEVDAELTAVKPLPLFPHRRHRVIETEEIREGLIDVLNLKPCGLLPLVAERNSSLGKVYAPSQKMVYELKFYDGITKCLSTQNKLDTADRNLISQLSAIKKIKANNLAAEIWNGFYMSEEIEQNFSIGEQPLPLTDEGAAKTMLTAFATLSQLAALPANKNEWVLPSFLEQIEMLYEPLHRNKSGSQILSSLRLVTQYLHYSADLIETRLETKPLCYNQTPTAKAKILRNVFYKYYAGEFQPYLAYVHKNAAEWFTLHTAVRNELVKYNITLSTEMTNYFSQVIEMNTVGSLWSDYETARHKHTQAWQKVLKQCGMMPTVNN